jgi:hypothetical protein
VELITTRRNPLTWCADVESYPPTKPLLRFLAEYATNINEKKALLFLCSAEGQGVFPQFQNRTSYHTDTTSQRFPILQISSRCSPQPTTNLHATILLPLQRSPRILHPSRRLQPHDQNRRHSPGFFERQRKFIEAEARGEKPNLRALMFKGLMANPLAREFVSDGPMLIGAGVGVATFRGFVQVGGHQCQLGPGQNGRGCKSIPNMHDQSARNPCCKADSRS